MCGICGLIKEDSILEEDARDVTHMNQSLFHRGPDSEGSMGGDKVSVSMRRLSIIDIDNGNQPLYNEDKSIGLVANGEIYNFVELRIDLEEKGHVFKTQSDCETIIHAYEEYGENFLSKLRGMFAFCLYDYKNNKVILARDRIGEKPLYIYKNKNKTYFSSELKSILELIPKENREIDLNSLYLYFYYGYVPDPRSIIKNIVQLPAGSYLITDLKTNSQEQIKYWEEKNNQEETDNPTTEIRNVLEEIEKIVIRSDVSVGVSLSGGIDSSLIAILASKNSKNKLHAFSVGYPNYPQNDERVHAQELAESLGMIFHNIEITEKEFVKDFQNMVGSMDDPIADVAAYGYYRVSKSARENKVPVLLAGFGGDELFWGYEWTRYAMKINDLKTRGLLGKCVALIKLFKYYERHALKKPFIILPFIIKAAFSNEIISYELNPLWIYTKKYQKDMFEDSFIKAIDTLIPSEIKKNKLSPENGSTLTKLLTKIWLLSNCINLGDRMSMTHSIELRLPLVDYKLYEKAQNIHGHNQKDYLLGHKHWLIESVRDILPKDIISRHKKGFAPPTTVWTKHIIEKYKYMLTEGYLVNKKIIRKDFMGKALTNIDRNIKFLYSAILFEVWADKYI